MRRDSWRLIQRLHRAAAASTFFAPRFMRLPITSGALGCLHALEQRRQIFRRVLAVAVKRHCPFVALF